MITLPENLDQPYRAAVFRASADGWSVLLGEIHDGRVRIEDSRAFSSEAAEKDQFGSEPEPSGRSEIDAWLEANGSPRVLVLLPAAQTISRVLDLSDAENPDQVDQELRLKAESHLLGGAPAHRVGMAALAARKGQPRQGILISWPSSSLVQPPSQMEGTYYVPDTAALLGMLPVVPCAQALIHADQQSGSVAVVLDSSDGLLVRSTREDHEQGDSWKDSIVRTVMETAIAGLEPTEKIKILKEEIEGTIGKRGDLQDVTEILMVPDSAQNHLKEITEGAGDSEWWKKWGLQIGALLANAGELSPLTRLQLRKKTESIGPLGEMTKTFSSLSTMCMMVLAVFIAATFIPIASSWLRLAIVQSKVDDIPALSASLTTFEQQKAVYGQMSGRSWPMTKLLGDLANCIPLGIQADTIIINEGDAIILRGRAGNFQGISAIALISEAMDRMESTQVFGDINYTSDPEDSSGLIQFSITATVRDPYKNVRNFAQDFGKTPHVQIRYPHAFEDEPDSSAAQILTSNDTEESTEDTQEGAMGEQAPVIASTGRETSDRAGLPQSGARARSGGAGNSGSARPSSRGSSSASSGGSSPSRRSEQTSARSSSSEAPIPDSLTDNEIAAMSRAELLDATSRNAKARQRDDLDEETSERLRTDFKRLLEATRNSSSGGN